MKLDSISSLVEILPFYGTLDEAYWMMGMMSRTTQDIWDKCKTKIGKIVNRKRVKMDLYSFNCIIDEEHSEGLIMISIFEINELTIRTIEEYKMLTKILNNCKVIDGMKINELRLCLSSQDNFSCTYTQACTQTVYTEEDRIIDAEYNLLVEAIEKINLNVRTINSILYSNEIKNRDIKYLNRVAILINEDEKDNNTIEQIKNVIEKIGININCYCFILNSAKCFNIKSKVHPNKTIFEKHPCKCIEIYCNSQLQNNILIKKCELIHIRPEDNIWEHDKYFKKSNWKLNDYHISTYKNIYIFSENLVAPVHASFIAESISCNLDNDHIDNFCDLVRIKKCNQMILKFNEESRLKYCTDFNNKYLATKKLKERSTCIYIEPNCITNLYKKSMFSNMYLDFERLKYYKIDSFEFKDKEKLLPILYNVDLRKREICLEINCCIKPDFSLTAFSKCISKTKTCAVETLSIEIKEGLLEKQIELILSKVLDITCLNKLNIKSNDLKILETYFSNLKKKHYNTSLKIESQKEIDIYVHLKLKKMFKSFKFVII